ncbi:MULTISPECIES: aminotransferase class I/II-fold pyridoxal phosphate-dependent enzyme [Rhodomicrobium]|nr:MULTISPECIES: aminotransferase class I/II-fold pyridoxal phosphate-dependent enzyme [Rhodomicrobium]
MDVMRASYEREVAGHDIVHMEVGQPGTPAPRAAREAVKTAIDRDVLGYTDALGMPALRERIARHYRDAYGVSVGPERIVVTAGSSAGFVLAFLALFDEGDGILLPEPGYPCYRNIVQALGMTPLGLPVGPDQRWMPSPALMEAHAAAGERPAGLLFASPANPTGTVMGDDALAAICAHCRARGLTLISDEIYHGLAFDRPAQTALAYDDEAIVINSFSKYYSMTGWRVGWMVVPPGLVRSVERLAQNFYISPAAISQVAALAAFDAVEELEANKAVYAANRALLINELPRAGFAKLSPPDGAFYIYADVSDLTGDAAGFATRMLEEAGVAVTPGIDFDPPRGHRFIRFSYAGTTEAMAEAARRLQAWRK